MSGIVFLTPCLASKSCQTLYPQSLTQLRQTSLHIRDGMDKLQSLVERTMREMAVFSWRLLERLVGSGRDPFLTWRLDCQSWAIDCGYKVELLFDARHGVKKQCQTWHRINQWLDSLMPCLASKSWHSFYQQSIAQLRQTSLNMIFCCFGGSNRQARPNFPLQYSWDDLHIHGEYI